MAVTKLELGLDEMRRGGHRPLIVLLAVHVEGHGDLVVGVCGGAGEDVGVPPIVVCPGTEARIGEGPGGALVGGIGGFRVVLTRGDDDGVGDFAAAEGESTFSILGILPLAVVGAEGEEDTTGRGTELGAEGDGEGCGALCSAVCLSPQGWTSPAKSRAWAPSLPGTVQ